ncbi:MAG: hypothetical protein AAF471_05540 [Myxococcota bacterium]
MAITRLEKMHAGSWKQAIKAGLVSLLLLSCGDSGQTNTEQKDERSTDTLHWLESIESRCERYKKNTEKYYTAKNPKPCDKNLATASSSAPYKSICESKIVGNTGLSSGTVKKIKEMICSDSMIGNYCLQLDNALEGQQSLSLSDLVKSRCIDIGKGNENPREEGM